MANVTDPLANTVSGTDPQNLMEYITRQRIYDSRFWKEECFGLTVSDVLEKASKLRCIGNLPTKFLSLVLKLLQLHPETDLVLEAFVDQDEFKYVRAVGCMYVRMTARPADIYEALEVRYRDFRKLRVWMSPEWSVLHVDEFVHELLTQTHVLGVALPRLPSRRTLEESGYLTPPRPTALKDVLEEHGGPLQYLRHLALVQQHPGAIEAWEKRRQPGDRDEKRSVEQWADSEETTIIRKRPASDKREEESRKEKKLKKKNDRSYGTLFKKSRVSTSKPSRDVESEGSAPPSLPANEDSEEYWNEQRSKLGLKPLQK
jgi:pre-mRNA-splicing factor 38A